MPTKPRVPSPLLERLVTNLVQNAIKYNHPGGLISVAVEASGRWCRPGLTIVRSIMTAHHGRLDADANADGGLTIGVTFRTP